MKPQRKVLIYNDDPAIRKAYATYLNRNGISADSCGALAELKRLLLWYEYEFILINIDSLTQAADRPPPAPALNTIIAEHQAGSPILIATSSQPEAEPKPWDYAWFLPEPLTPKGLLTAISQIRQQQPNMDSKSQLKLRKSLSKPMTFD